MDPVVLARLQFALIIGLACFIVLLSGLCWRTGRTVYFDLMRFWLRIFALAFGMGVMTRRLEGYGEASPTLPEAE
jgi:cytochrome d ubiquinol oxidase subunit I